jgi:hypothetical protein
MTICKLCNQDTKLCQSHILPEFLYTALYDKKHRALVVSKSSLNNEFIQKGFKEPLLCQQCETQFSRYEMYAKEIINKILLTHPDAEGYSITIHNVDYPTFELFLLSILWRAGISSHNMFKNVNLGTKHENKLREMLLSENPGIYYEYGCIPFILPNPKYIDKIISQPTNKNKDAQRIYCFSTGNLQWNFIVSSHTNRFQYRDFFLSTSGILRIFLNPKSEEEILKKILNHLKPTTL